MEKKNVNKNTNQQLPKQDPDQLAKKKIKKSW